MLDKNNANPYEDRNQAEKRKKDHISLSFNSETKIEELNKRFYYEPLLAAFPNDHTDSIPFLSKTINFPIWISSMTGGSDLAKKINHNLARVAGEYKLGMGLGSCRSLLYNDTFFEDFNLRPLIGDQPLYANLGIAQVAYLLQQNKGSKIKELIDKLQADGLIVHVNPLQEFMQKEGDIFTEAPILTITKLIEQLPYLKVIVKEVGQGMGMDSLKHLLNLPLEAIEFAAYGGTNFSKLEQLRDPSLNEFDPLCYIGHTAEDMVNMTNEIYNSNPDILCRQLIISGGIKDYLDGYYLINKSQIPAIYGQAGNFLKYAKGDYDTLQAYVEAQINGLKMANAYLKLR